MIQVVKKGMRKYIVALYEGDIGTTIPHEEAAVMPERTSPAIRAYTPLRQLYFEFYTFEVKMEDWIQG